MVKSIFRKLGNLLNRFLVAAFTKKDGDEKKLRANAPEAIADAPEAIADAPEAIADAPEAIADAPEVEEDDE